MKRITIDDDLFKALIYITVNCTQEKWCKWLETLGVANFPVTGAGGHFVSVESVNGTCSYCIWVESFDWKVKEQGWLNHELIHCAVTILQERGINISDETEEVLAYYHTYLKEQAYIKLRRGT
jgi:hypothetical protein